MDEAKRPEGAGLPCFSDTATALYSRYSFFLYRHEAYTSGKQTEQAPSKKRILPAKGGKQSRRDKEAESRSRLHGASKQPLSERRIWAHTRCL